MRLVWDLHLWPLRYWCITARIASVFVWVNLLSNEQCCLQKLLTWLWWWPLSQDATEKCEIMLLYTKWANIFKLGLVPVAKLRCTYRSPSPILTLSCYQLTVVGWGGGVGVRFLRYGHWSKIQSYNFWCLFASRQYNSLRIFALFC